MAEFGRIKRTKTEISLANHLLHDKGEGGLTRVYRENAKEIAMGTL